MAQIDDLKTMLGITGSDEDALLTIHLNLARDFIARYRNSYDLTDPDNPVPEVETAYENVQLLMASESYSKAGAEGETAHTEAGIKRTYESGTLYSKGTLSLITPKVKVVAVYEDTEEE